MAEAMPESKLTEKKVYEVNIAGIPVKLKSSHNEELVKELTEFVDKKLQDAKQSNPSASFQNILFLTCLHLAEELVSQKDHLKTQLKDIQSEALQLLSDLESSPLNQASLDN